MCREMLFLLFSLVFIKMYQTEGGLTHDYGLRLLSEDVDVSFSQLHWNNTQLTLQCQLYGLEWDSLTSCESVGPCLTTGSTLTVIISNSSWYQLFTIPSPQINASEVAVSWLLNITSDLLGVDNTAWLPQEQWTISAELKMADNQVLHTEVLVLALHTEPLLQWELGASIDSIPQAVLDNTTSTLVSRSPCVPDVALMAFQTATAVEIIYLGTTYGAFGNDTVKWYGLSSSDLCAEVNADCSSLQLFDIALMNHQVALLTDVGLLVSNDLRECNRSLSVHAISWNRTLELCSTACVIQSASLGYTPTCLYRQHDLLTGDVLAVTYTIQTGSGDSYCMYSIEPFLDWHSAFSTSQQVGGFSASHVLSCQYNEHTNTMATLVSSQEGNLSVVVRPLHDNQSLSDLAYFPAFVFPTSADVTQIFYTPMSYLMYATGSQIWVSEDGGNHFKLLYESDNATDRVLRLMASRSDTMLTVDMSSGSLLFGQMGVSHVMELQSRLPTVSYSLSYVDSLGQMYVLDVSGLASSQIIKTQINITQELQDSSISHPHPLSILYISAQEAYVFEHASINSTDSDNITAKLSQINVGQLIKARGGGAARILEVYSDKLSAGILSRSRVRLLEPFKSINQTDSPAIQYNLEVTMSDKSTQQATLGLSSFASGADGWLSSDVGHTVVVPGYSSFLLTDYINSSHIDGTAVVYVNQDTQRAAGAWFLLDLGIHDGEIQWYIVEDQCRHEFTTSGLFQRQSQFELDLGDSLVVYVAVQPKDYSDARWNLDDQIYATVSNPWLLKLTPSLEALQQPPSQKLTLTLKTFVWRKGVTAVRFNLPMSSLLCPQTSLTLVAYAGCPSRKQLVFLYPQYISDEDYLHANPVDKHERPLLRDLEANYRPPSTLGIGIPTSEHIYNADPGQPRPRNRFRISQNTGSFKQCAGKNSRAACGCTDGMKLSAEAQYTDCKERVYRLLHPGRMPLSFAIQQPNMPDIPANDQYAITITELNDRNVTYKREGSSILLDGLQSDSHFSDSDQYYSPISTEIAMDGSGLYHYRAKVIPGLSLCALKVDLQVFVDRTPIAYPLNYVLNFTMVFVIGCILFVVYMWYLINYHARRVRKTGSQCLDLHQMANTEGLHPPKV